MPSFATMPVVKNPAKKKGPSLEERMRMVAAAEAKARKEKMKKRDRRGPITRFIEWLPKWWTRVNENNTSLYLFHEKSRVRRNAWRLIRWKWFDRTVMAAIVINCAFLAMYDPTQPDDSSGNQMLNLVEMAFTVVFTIEFVIQIVRGISSSVPGRTSRTLGSSWTSSSSSRAGSR